MGVPMFRGVELMRMRVKSLTIMNVQCLYRCHVRNLEVQNGEVTTVVGAQFAGRAPSGAFTEIS